MVSNENYVPFPDHDFAGSVVLNRADEVDDLLSAVQALIIPFIRSADDDAVTKHTGQGLGIPGNDSRTVLLESIKPEKLVKLLDVNLPTEGRGKKGLLEVIQSLLKYSVNTWDQGFMDKLYGSTNAVGVVSELILAVLNTNLHVYQVSPALTLIEKTTARALATRFGFTGSHAGGISTQGGSASNTTAMIIARNILFPKTKDFGNGPHNFVIFTSAHGHYSLQKAAQMCGFGASAVCPVPVDERGCMVPGKLEELINESQRNRQTPLFVNATAGTTVLGSYDPIPAISKICVANNLWLHIDASWGGPVIFSEKLKGKLTGSHLANSIAVNPHKMLGVPVTCSFLLGADMTQFHAANTLPAAYLFHGDKDSEDVEVWDLADLTLQCGRRGDSLKLALSWIYYGASGFESQIDNAFLVAAYFASTISRRSKFVLVSENPPPCLQVCFYYSAGGNGLSADPKENTKVTKDITRLLLSKGFMIDYAPGDRGSFFRAVVNTQTRKETIDGLIKAIEDSVES